MLLPCLSRSAQAQWQVLPPSGERQPWPSTIPEDAQSIEPGDEWPQDDKFRWVMSEVTIPEKIDDKPVRGKPVGMRINCGDGGAVFVEGELQCRFDNDHPALAVIAEKAEPGTKVRVGILVYARVQGGDSFGEAQWVIVSPERVRDRATLRVHPDKTIGEVPDGIAGLSQGGGLADYEDATAAKLVEGGFKWFRMDNVFTQVVKDKDGQLVYDWADFDKRVDFIAGKMGADPILCASYMPIPFDAVENHDRQSAPRDYELWEDLCYRAAKRCIERGVRVPYWEVWNEVNTGWLKPGPQDTGADKYRKIYNEARGEEQFEEEVIRRFEAYCKLYAATVRGVRRADPKAKFGGPALASGPFEHKNCGHCFHGRGFAKGLMSFCQKEGLPLDFVSWHEYFHPHEVFTRQVKAFREYLSDFPELQKTVKSYMITEWNEAWWANRPMDHEVGAAWCANSITRSFIPHEIDRPCLFYVKQGDMRFRGDFSILMADNVPKATFNVLKIFNHLSGEWLDVSGEDDDLSAVACWDARRGRLAMVVVNYRDRYAVPRKVNLQIDRLPDTLVDGHWREWTVDATHSNVWHDKDSAELEQTNQGRIKGRSFEYEQTLMPNSVTLVELLASDKP